MLSTTYNIYGKPVLPDDPCAPENWNHGEPYNMKNAHEHYIINGVPTWVKANEWFRPIRLVSGECEERFRVSFITWPTACKTNVEKEIMRLSEIQERFPEVYTKLMDHDKREDAEFNIMDAVHEFKNPITGFVTKVEVMNKAFRQETEDLLFNVRVTREDTKYLPAEEWYVLPLSSIEQEYPDLFVKLCSWPLKKSSPLRRVRVIKKCRHKPYNHYTVTVYLVFLYFEDNHIERKYLCKEELEEKFPLAWQHYRRREYLKAANKALSDSLKRDIAHQRKYRLRQARRRAIRHQAEAMDIKRVMEQEE